MCALSPPTLSCSTFAASLKSNNLNNNAKRLLQDTNCKRSKPAILEI